jgi:hypothetical protein
VPHVQVEVLGPVRARVDGAPADLGYPAETLQRLRRIKRERDPRGTIRSNKPVLGA